jgi:hypothetical protein
MTTTDTRRAAIRAQILADQQTNAKRSDEALAIEAAILAEPRPFVRYDRETRDYAAYRVIDGVETYVGSSASYSQALATAQWGTAE